MAKNKLSKDTDLASGFFSTPAYSDDSSVKITNKRIEAPVNPTTEDTSKIKNVGGRPQKEGLKNEQFTLTMNPELYEKLKIIATEKCRGNFSGLIDEAIKSYCRENNINLSEITVDKEILKTYSEKQEKKKLNKK